MTAARWLSLVGVALLVAATLLTGLWRFHARPQESVVIHWNTTHQTIDGLGASATGYIGAFTREKADQFFDEKTGLGLSLLRLAIVPDTVNEDCGCVSNNSPFKCVAGSKSQILSGDLQIAQLAAARGVRLIASPWSPPAEMKTSGTFCGVGSMKGNPENYAEYASHLASFPALLKANGIALDAISIQNEPDLENDKYDTCRWTGQQIHDFIPYLYEALNAAGFETIKIAAPEESEWTFDLLDPAMKDTAVAGKIGLIMGHAYRAERPSGLPDVGGRHVWQTEASGSDRFDGGMKDGLQWARYIHNYMTIGTNAWMYWSLDCSEQFYNKKNNMCLTDERGRLAKRAYVLGQYAKFVRPGWQRIGVTNRGSLLVTAYKGPENKFAIVAVNNGEWEVRNQTFELRGVTGLHPRVAPWITSTSLSLQKQPEIPLPPDGTEFAYTIPAASVVTFEGWTD